MFTRFRQTARRLQVSLVETRRSGGQVRHSHVASLGAIRVSPSAADRIAFWTKLHQRLATLANRIDSKTHSTILTAVHARIPMPTPDDQRAVQLENAKADAHFWEAVRDMHAGTAESSKALVARLARNIADSETAAVEAANKTQAATERLAKIERGEDAGGFGKAFIRENLIAALGWKPSDISHAARLAAIDELGGWDDMMAEVMKRHRQTEKAASRAVLKRRARA
jgi:hypothetical protein